MLDRELRLHPGSGSRRPMGRGCTVRGNGTNGLFVCLRVRHGVFEYDRLVDNGQYGSNGVFFRDEVAGMSPPATGGKPTSSRTTAGNSLDTAGIRVRGETAGFTDKENVIRDTRRGSKRTQTMCILVEDWLGAAEIPSKWTIRLETITPGRRGSDPIHA